MGGGEESVHVWGWMSVGVDECGGGGGCLGVRNENVPWNGDWEWRLGMDWEWRLGMKTGNRDCEWRLGIETVNGDWEWRL